VKEVNGNLGASLAADIYNAIDASVTAEQEADAYSELIRIEATPTAEPADKIGKPNSPLTDVEREKDV